MTGKSLVILGSDVTALSVVRGAHQSGMKPIVFDIRRGVACRSSLAQIEFHKNLSDRELTEALYRLGDNGERYLIATSDYWLRAIIRNRTEFEKSYKQVLHATSEVLATCLNKKMFAHWCGERNIEAPNLFLEEEAIFSRRADGDARPVILRPTMSAHAEINLKSQEIHDVQSLNYWTKFCRERSIDFVVTESLLGQDLTQYSVPFVRTNLGISSFVARKVRPYPSQCAVGTYVELSPNPEVESLAQRVADELNYHGIGEVEILYSSETGKKWVIEVNPRPWTQYALAINSRHDFLKCLLEEENCDFSAGVKSGKRWMNFGADLINCFSPSVGHVRRGHVSFGEYLSSVLRANVFPLFCWNDLAPMWYSFKKLARRVRKGSRENSPTPARLEE